MPTAVEDQIFEQVKHLVGQGAQVIATLKGIEIALSSIAASLGQINQKVKKA